MNEILIKFCASILIWLIYVSLVVLWYSDGRVKKEQVLHAVIASALAFVASYFLKDIFYTPRPFVADGIHPLVFYMPKTNGSFPSMHEAASFAIAVTIFRHNRKIGIFYVIAAIIVGFSRVMANVHYPVDIVGGVVVGIVMALIVERVHIKITTRKRG